MASFIQLGTISAIQAMKVTAVPRARVAQLSNGFSPLPAKGHFWKSETSGICAMITASA